MKAVKFLVKIAVMMMAPGGAPAPPEERGGEPPFFFFFFVDLLPRWEKGFPSGPWLPWRGRGERPSEIVFVSLSLSVSVFLDSALSPFLLYLEIRNSDWGESFAQIFLVKLAFLRQKRASTALQVSQESARHNQGGWSRLLSPGHLGHRFALIFLPNFPYFPKISSVHFYPVWTPFDIPFL